MGRILRQHVALRAGAQPAEESVAELFHENTKLHRSVAILSTAADSYGVTEIEAMSRAYKRYPQHPQRPLPAVERDRDPAFGEVITRRRTERAFATEPLDLADLSALLQWSYGITGSLPMQGGGVQPLRAAPSAGGLYPAEIYLGVRDVRGLEPGLYHFEVPSAALALLRPGDVSERLQAVCCGQQYARDAAVVILISAVADRTMRKYGDRGYRYVLLDIGHLGQNLCLAGTALDLGVVTTCGFFDDEAADLLDIDGTGEAVVYVAFVGRLRERTPCHIPSRG
jgi:SagB-type dehydrogenase family enzyme